MSVDWSQFKPVTPPPADTNQPAAGPAVDWSQFKPVEQPAALAPTPSSNPQGFGLYADPALDPRVVSTKGLPGSAPVSTAPQAAAAPQAAPVDWSQFKPVEENPAPPVVVPKATFDAQGNPVSVALTDAQGKPVNTGAPKPAADDTQDDAGDFLKDLDEKGVGGIVADRYGPVLKSGAVNAVASTVKPVMLAAGTLGVIADGVTSLVTGKPTTAAQDAIFKYGAASNDAWADKYAAQAPKDQGIDQKVVGDIPGILGTVAQAAATDGEETAEDVALKLPEYTQKTADYVRQAFAKGFRGMSAPAMEAGVDTVDKNVKQGVDLNTAVQQGIASALQTEMMGVIPLNGPGGQGAMAAVKRMATGAVTMPAFTEMGRRISNAIYGAQYADQQQGYDPAETISSAIEGAGFGLLPHDQTHGATDFRSPEEQAQSRAQAIQDQVDTLNKDRAAEAKATSDNLSPEHKDLLNRSLADVEQQIPQATGADLAELQQRRVALKEALGSEPSDTAAPEGAEPTQEALDAKDAATRTALTKPTKLMTPAEKDAALDTDILTLLPNRRAFMANDQEQPAAAYTSMDLVGFKGINDTVGHAAGDQMLKAFGQVIRQTGLPIARTGGDEFTGSHSSPEEAEAAMQTLKAKTQGLQFHFQTPDGKPVTIGLDFRYGIGNTPEIADEAQVRTRATGQQASAPGAGDVSGAGEAPAGQQVPGSEPVEGAQPTQGAPAAKTTESAPSSAESDEGPVTTVDMTRKGPPASPLNPTKDHLLAAIAKSGGLNSGEAKSIYGFDPADMRMAFGHGIKRVFTKNGMKADQMAELLNQHGYPVQDEKGNYDAHVLMEQVEDSLRGKKVYSTHAADLAGDSAAAAHEQTLKDAEADRAAGAQPEDYSFGTGHDAPEDEYPDDFTPQMRVARDMADKAMQMDPETTEPVIERWGKDAITTTDAVKEFETIINARSESHGQENQVPDEAGPVSDAGTAGSGDQERTREAPAAGSARQPGFALSQESAPKAGGPRRAVQTDMLGGATETQQALHRERLKRDEARNSGQDSVETGNAGDMFSQKGHDKPLFSLSDKEDGGSRHNSIINASIAFGRAVDEVKSSGPTRAGKVDLGPTPDVLLKTGAKDLPLRIDPDVIRKAFSKHNIPPQTLKLLPRALHEPMMVFDSKVRRDSKVVVTDLKDSKGHPIAVTVHLDAKEGRNDINDITSIHGRSHGAGIVDWIKGGLLRYQDKEKSRKWSQSGGFNMPAEETTPSPAKKVLSEADVVKPFSRGPAKPAEDQKFRLAPAGREGQLKASAEKAIAPLRKQWGDQAPRIVVHQSESNLPGHHQDEIKAVGPSGRVEGFYDPDTHTVHLIADNLKTPADVVRTLLHEVRGHARLRDVFGKDVEPILNRVLNTYGKKGLQDIVDHYGLDWDNRDDRLTAAEEKIAKIAETGENPSLLQHVISFIRGYLRKLFPDMKFSDAEIHQLVHDMNRGLDRPETEHPIGEPAHAGARFSLRGEQAYKDFETLKGTAVDRAHEFAKQKASEGIHALGDILERHTPEPVQDFFGALHKKMGYVGNEVDKSLKPLDAGNEDTAALAKRHANSEAETKLRVLDSMDKLSKDFTPEQRQRIWDATSAESVAKVTGVEAKGGFATLSPKEREAAIQLQKDNDPIADEAVRLGILKHRYQIYDPRFLAGIAQDHGGSNVLNPMGHDIRLTTPHALAREHLTADESEKAAQALYGDKAHLIRDARILPFAGYQLQRIINAHKLIRAIDEYGQGRGERLVLSGNESPGVEHKGYKSIDNPAFTYAGKQAGLFASPKLWIHPDLEGPLRAVLTKSDHGILVRSALSLKSKAMSTIVGAFPPIHRSTVFFKTAVTYPMSMFSGRLQAMGKDLRLSNSEEKYQAARDGLRDVSRRGWVGTVEDLDTEPRIDDKVGQSWTAQMLGAGAHVAGMPAGKGKEWQQTVKEAVDDAGHFWHSTLMWEKVANTQYGLYRMVKADLVKRGMEEDGAGKVAAQVANRFVGAIAKEDMSESARTVLNLSLFSRSFTMSNLGLYKDALGSGLPKAVVGQISAADRALANNFYRRKAAGALIKDIAALSVTNAALQSAVAYWTKQETGDQIVDGYKKRFAEYVAAGMQNPLHFLTRIGDISPTSRNEPGKDDYIFLGRNAQGTGMYLKNPFGKVGFDLLHWLTSPLQELSRKESTILGPAIKVASNDKGYGRQIYSPQDAWQDEVMDVAKYLINENTPSQLIHGAYDAVTGKDRSTSNLAQSALSPFGLFVSHGAPGGPPEGFMYAAEKQHDFDKQQALPDIRKAILNGDDATAVRGMVDAHMTAQEIRTTIENTLAPGKTLDKQRIMKVVQYMTPEQRQAFMDSFRQQ